MKQTPVIILWSGGVESYQTLFEIKKSKSHSPICLLSILDAKTNLLPQTGVKESLLVKQAELLKTPLQRVYIEDNNYKNLHLYLERFAKQGIKTLATNSIYNNIKFDQNIEVLNPLAKVSSSEIAKLFFQSQAKAVITSVKTALLDNSFLAKEYNQEYIERLPQEIDPIGRNNEFKTFVYFGEGFKTRVPFSKSIGLTEDDFTVSHLKDA